MNALGFLVQSQNADGGWGYRVGGMSYVEPTAAVLLALRSDALSDDGSHAVAGLGVGAQPAISISAEARGRDFLLALQHGDGGWGIGALDAESGWMTAWAVRALANAERADARDAVIRGVNWLTATEGLRVTAEVDRAKIGEMFQIDSTLRGWPWQPGDAAWVHPTALVLLALIDAGRRDEPRVREGVAYLFDRAAPRGGWNIGNPWMLDKQIPATIQDTAVALLALRAANVSSDERRIAQAIDFLRGAVARAKTPAELAWGVYALGSWNGDAGDSVTRLSALQSADGSWSGNPFITAIAMLASQK